MKRLLSAIAVLASAVGASVLKAKGNTTAAILTLLVGAGAAGGILYLNSYAAELTQIPTNFTSGDFGFLDASITSSSTTITVSPITKWVNGTKTSGCFDSGSGFVLIQDGAGRTEYASYGTKSCASNVTTLSDIRRGLDPTGSSFDAGTGLAFAASTSIRVINWAGIFNNAAYKIQRNVFTGSGKVICDTTRQTCLNAGSVNSTVRDAMTVEQSDILYNTTSGTMEFYNGSNWIQFGSGTTINASETQDGKVSIAGTGSMLTGSGQGINGATAVVSSKYLTASGGLSGANAAGFLINAGFVPVLEDSGFLSGSLLAQGPTATTFLRGDQTWATPTAGSGTNIVAEDVDTSNSAINSASYTPIDSTNLSESIFVEDGSVLVFHFSGSAKEVSGCPATATVELNIQKDGTEIETASGGILRVNFAGFTSLLETNVSFTYPWTSSTEETAVFRPSYKNTDDGGAACIGAFDDAIHFRVVKSD